MTALLPLTHLKVEHNYTGSSWQDFTGDLAGLQVNLRELPGNHTASLSFYRVNMDPSQSSATTVIKKGDLVRIHAHNASSTLRKMATLRVKKVDVSIDLKAAPGRQNRVNVSLIGTGVAGVAGVGKAAGVDTINELSNIITGAPYEIGGDGFGSGITTPTGSYTEVSSVDAATELDQILLTRDGNPGVVAFEDPSGAIQVFDSAVHRTAAPGLTLTAANYSSIDQQFDMSHIINVVAIRYFEKIKVGKKPTRVVEHDVVFENAASIAKYGRFKKTVKVHKKSNFSAYATSVFARNADPENVPASVTIPMRTAADLLPGYEDGHFVGGKVKVTLPNGTTTYTCRVARIQHTISPTRWTVQVFLRDQNIMHRPHSHSAARLTSEVANTPDGMVLTAHLDDGAVTSPKTAYPVIGGISSTPPAAPKANDLWLDSGNGFILKTWNGASWVSAQDAAIAAAQSTANGKNRVTYSGSDPGSTANTAGDLWFTFAGTILTKQWKGNGGTSWTQVTLADTVIANLDAGKITTGFLAAARLQAQSIGTEKLVVGDSTNIVVDGSGDDLGTWTGLGSGWTIATPTLASPGDRNSKTLRYTAGNAYEQMNEAKFAVQPGDVYTLSTYLRRVGTATGAGSIGLFLFFYDASNTFVGTGTPVAGGPVTTDQANTTVPTTWTQTTVSVQVPTGAAFAAVTFRATAGITGGQYEYDQVFAGRQISGALLVNGAIDGKLITGPVIQTATGLGTGGSGLKIENDLSGGVIKFYAGQTGETAGFINPTLLGDTSYGLDIRTPKSASGGGSTAGRLVLQNSQSGIRPQLTLSNGTDLVMPSGSIGVGAGTTGGAAGTIFTSGLAAIGGDLSARTLTSNTQPTTTSAANVRMGAAGLLNLVTSRTAAKVDPKPIPLERLRSLARVTMVEWIDREEFKANKRRKKGLRKYAGVLAEDVEAIDPVFGDYHGDTLIGVSYDRLALAALPLVDNLYDLVERQAAQIEALTQRIETLEAD